MNVIQRAGFRHLRSWKREEGGTYAIYAAIHSRAYSWHMRRLHRRGLHSPPRYPSISPRCTWCVTAVGS